eukprot:9779347-Heterocapsa_arctica.AAC.1
MTYFLSPPSGGGPRTRARSSRAASPAPSPPPSPAPPPLGTSLGVRRDDDEAGPRGSLPTHARATPGSRAPRGTRRVRDAGCPVAYPASTVLRAATSRSCSQAATARGGTPVTSR